jgi:hypothetical protein
LNFRANACQSQLIVVMMIRFVYYTVLGAVSLKI